MKKMNEFAWKVTAVDPSPVFCCILPCERVQFFPSVLAMRECCLLLTPPGFSLLFLKSYYYVHLLKYWIHIHSFLRGKSCFYEENQTMKRGHGVSTDNFRPCDISHSPEGAHQK